MTKRIVTIIGARPQFVKAAVLSRLIRSDEWKKSFNEILIHTGQHYDDNMSEVFFRDMEIPKPDIHLNISGGTHGVMTGRMLIEIEQELINLNPDLVLVYGDTNSTIAGALAAAKLHIPLAHIEAGLRSYYKLMPEEQNRVLTDHLSDWLFCPTKTAVSNLAREGIRKNVYHVGDIMLDASDFYRNLIETGKTNVLSALNSIEELDNNVLNGKFLLATVHRAENTDDPEKLANITAALNELHLPVILPLHPRTKKMMAAFGLNFSDNVNVIPPVGYFEMLKLEMSCEAIITDSGGVQKEAYFLKKPCITLREQTEWTETEKSGWNTIAGTGKINILRAVEHISKPENHPNFFGTGDAGSAILDILSKNGTDVEG